MTTYYEANRERILSRQRAYQAENPEVVKRAQARYKAKHVVKLKEYRRERYATEKDIERERHRAWVAKNKDARAAYMREWRAKAKGHRKAYDAAYRAAHQQERADSENVRRARKSANGGSHTREEWSLLKQAFGHACAYCNRVCDRLSKDHDIPLSRGGTDAIGNIVPACLPCNRRKHAKTGAEFAALLRSERC